MLSDADFDEPDEPQRDDGDDVECLGEQRQQQPRENRIHRRCWPIGGADGVDEDDDVGEDDGVVDCDDCHR